MAEDGEVVPEEHVLNMLEMEANSAAMAPKQGSLGSLLAPDSNLRRRLQMLDPVRAAVTFAGLLTVPRLQANCYRVETLVRLALALGNGRQKPSSQFIARAFRELGEGYCGMMEDPSEDMFVAAVRCRAGNFRVLEGLWEGSGFYLERFLEVLEEIPRALEFNRLRAAVLALLRLSDLTCERAKLERWHLGGTVPLDALDRKTQNALLACRHRIRFRIDELAAYGIGAAELEPFLFDLGTRHSLADEEVSSTRLERQPLVQEGPYIWLVMPTAVSTAIRHFVIESMLGNGQGETFHRALAFVYARLFHDTPLLGGHYGAPIVFGDAEHSAIAEATTEIDTGRHLHFLFFTDRLAEFEEAGFSGLNPDGAAVGADIATRISSAYQRAVSQPGFRDGLTVVVGCGVGRGISFEVDRGKWPGWRIVFAPAYDLHTLSWTREFRGLTLWRILDAQDAVAGLGTMLMNINGLINLVGWVRSLDGHIVPHSQMPETAASGIREVMLMVDQASQRRVRHESFTSFDPRVEQDIEGVWCRLRRDNISIFDDDRYRPVFASEELGASGRPMLAYLAPSRVWWAEVHTSASLQGSAAYQRWQIVELWLSRAAPVLDDFSGLPAGPVQWTAVFEGEIDGQEGEPPRLGYEEARAEITVGVDAARRTVTTTATARWELAQFHPENIAERALVAALIDGIAQLSRNGIDEAKRAALLSQIVPDPQARQGHAFLMRDFRDHVSSDLRGHVIKISREDDAITRLGLGWQVRDPKDGGRITGAGDCMAFLNRLVENLEEGLCADLHSFNRRTFLTALLHNAERAAFDRDQWHRTAAAVLALHQDQAATLAGIAQHEFQLNAVFLASRNLVEMAICECPLNGGFAPGELDLSRLMARAALLFGMGGMSDAIRWGLMPPELRVMPLGDVHGDFGWVEEVVAPFAREATDDRVTASARDYSKNLEGYAINLTVADAFDPDFLAAWQEQFGATLDETRTFVDFVEDLGIKAGKAVIEMPLSVFCNIEVAGQRLDEPAASRLIGELTLQPRIHWRITPPGFEDRDRFPWRFRRRLSILRRPLIQLDENDDPAILVAPGILREAFRYSLSNLFRGDFPDSQLVPRMQAWRARTVGNRGTLLACEVEGKLNALGWSTRVEIKVTELLGRSFERDYGDVDVLAWRQDKGSRVLVIECKDVQYRKTEGEIAEQLADFRGEVRADGRRDDLRKHLDRMDILHAHLPAIARFTGISDLQDLESHLLFRHPVPMKYALARMSEKVQVCHLDEIEIVGN